MHVSLNISIESSNAAFDHDPWARLAAILAELSRRVEEGASDHVIRDENGNRIGRLSARVEEDEDDEITECFNAPDWCRENIPECSIHSNWFFQQGQLIGQLEEVSGRQITEETRRLRAEVRERILDASQADRVECMNLLRKGMTHGRKLVRGNCE